MAIKMPRNPLLVVLGATGTGKSQVAVDLALRFNGEIINADAMQLYSGLPIVTNKITTEEQHGIPHHLLGCIGLDEDTWRVGVWRREASKIISEIRSRGRIPVVVGGTHYYTQSLLFQGELVEKEGDATPEYDGEDREPNHEEISRKFPILESETSIILQKLREVDPLMAERWHPKDRRKIRRSLEIFLTSGKKASDVYAQQREDKELKKSNLSTDSDSESEHCPASALFFWVHAENDILKQRLDSRVLKMLEAGLLEEVQSLEDFLRKKEKDGNICDRTRGIWPSIGWKEFKPYCRLLKTGEASKTELNVAMTSAVEQTQAATRQYANRQVRWIRLKLIPALIEHNLLDHLYLLDSSDVSRFTEAVSNAAISISQDFLAGKPRPLPQDLSPLAMQYLGTVTQKPDVWFRKTCDLCSMTAVTDLQWQTHVKSRRHKALVRKKQKNDVQAQGPELRSENASGFDTA